MKETSRTRISERRLARPSLGQVFSAQLRLIPQRVGRGVPVALLVIALQLTVVALWGVVFAVQIQISEAPEASTGVLWTHVGELAEVVDFPLDQGTAAVAVAFVVSMLWGFLGPVIVWRDQRPAGRSYHWTMPVERWHHDLLRTAAGACWVVALAAMQAAVAVLAATLSGHGELLGIFSLGAWLNLLLSPLVPYLLFSAAVVRSDRPWAWVFAVLGVVLFGWAAAFKAGLAGVLRFYEVALISQPASLARVLVEPVYNDFLSRTPAALGPWFGGLLLWLGLGLGLVTWAARSRRHGL